MTFISVSMTSYPHQDLQLNKNYHHQTKQKEHHQTKTKAPAKKKNK